MDPEPLARKIKILQNKNPVIKILQHKNLSKKSSHKNPVIRTLS